MPARRECLPSEDRDAYVASRRKSGINEVAVRLTERYIDEFLRFCDEEYGYSDAKKITAKGITAYAAAQKKQGILKQTKRVKIREVLNWLEWLTEQKRLDNNPGADLETSELVP